MVQRVIAYVDGSNFYHLALDNYGLTGIDIGAVVEDVLAPDERLVAVKYYNAPVNKQEEPTMAVDQQRYFGKIGRHPLVSIRLGKLVVRPIATMNGACKKCGTVRLADANCPRCARLIDLGRVYRHVEKGVDVKIAMDLLLDAIDDRYDTALLVSSDADFVPAVQHVRKLGKRVVYCRFPQPCTNDLLLACGGQDRVLDATLLKQHQV